MILNLISNEAHHNGHSKPLGGLSMQLFKTKISYAFVNESRVVDPISRLLESVKKQKVTVNIPSQNDIIKGLWENEKIGEKIYIDTDQNGKIPAFDQVRRFPTVFKNQRTPEFPTAQHKLIAQKLGDTPVYAITTSHDELIMAVGRNVEYKSVFDWLYRKYYESFVWMEDKGTTALVLFFINKEDADLYLQSLGESNSKICERFNGRVQTTTLNYFYKLSRTSSPGQQTRLIADLREVSNVINNYLPNKLGNVNPKQRYRRNQFNGTPIYSIKVIARNLNCKQEQLELNKLSCERCFNQYFFRLEDAYSTWEKLRRDIQQLKLAARPRIEIYNLEEYLTDLEKAPLELLSKITFVPTLRPSNSIQAKEGLLFRENASEKITRLHKLIVPSLKPVRKLYKGITWLFTSDTLPTTDNAW